MISCIIPTTKNEASHLLTLLPSLLDNIYKSGEEVEILIIENGEKGLVEGVVRQMQDPHLIYHHLPQPSRSKAKNFGVEVARGEVVVFMDADNSFEGRLFGEIGEKGREEKFFGGGCKRLNLSTNLWGVKIYFLFILILFTLKRLWNPLNPFSVGIFWFKKEAFDKIGGWKDINLRDFSPLFSFIPEQIQPADDILLGKKMKDYEKKTGLKFESLKQTTCVWNTRKFNKDEWFWLKFWRNR